MLAQALLHLALLASTLALAQSVSDEAPGFATGTTGGAAGKTVTPTTTDELVTYLESDDALTIILTKTFDFTGTEGTSTGTGCAPWCTASGCQLVIDANDWCSNYESDAPSVSVTYDVAGTNPISVKGDKRIIGSGTSGVIKGKGLSLSGDVDNIIIQNIQITDLNPEYVWGGDAITLNRCSNVWVDHVTINLIGRMMIVVGYETNINIAITNNDFDGETDWSATCNGEHYWGFYLTGTNDQITLKGNYIHHTSGRSPKMSADTILHPVNKYWSNNSGHAFEGDSSYVLLEGSIFDGVTEAEADFTGSIYAPTSVDSACSSALGRSCAATTYTDSGALTGTDSDVLSQFKGLTVADADTDASAVPTTAGIGKLSASSTSSKNSTRRSVIRRAGQWRM